LDPPPGRALLFKWYNLYIMPRDHFSKVMHSPYFQSHGYGDTAGGQVEKKLYERIAKIKNAIKKPFRKINVYR
jgi:hypothetical protein